MAQLTPTLFTRHILTNEEELAGIQYTTEQRMFMQNIIADSAEEKVRLTFDPANPNVFIQREAELQGIIGVLSGLLSRYDEYMSALVASNLNNLDSE
jgi:hypothetical protein